MNLPAERSCCAGGSAGGRFVFDRFEESRSKKTLLCAYSSARGERSDGTDRLLSPNLKVLYR